LRRARKRVKNGDEACYFKSKTYFTKRGLKKRNTLHEFFHFLTDVLGLEMPAGKEFQEILIVTKEFTNKVVESKYSGNWTQAILDLMKKAVLTKK
jgi:hypothetical protein